MAQLTASGIKKALTKFFSALDSTDDDLVSTTTKFRWKERVYITDGGTAGTAQTATAFWANELGCNVRVVAAKLITPVAVTANASTNVTVTLDKVDAAGSNAATIAAYTSDVAGGSTVAFVPKALTNTVANVIVANGWILRIAASKASTGVAIAAATSQAYVEVTLEPQT